MFRRFQCILTLVGCILGSVEVLTLNSSSEWNVTSDSVPLVAGLTSHVENMTAGLDHEDMASYSDTDANFENDTDDNVTKSQSVTQSVEITTSNKNNDVSVHQDVNSLSDGLPDAKAYVGRIFEYSLADNAIFGDQDNQIEVSEGNGGKLPVWLLYDSNQRRLIGVPTQEDVGEIYISVKTLCLPNSPCFKDVFLLMVLKSNYGFKNSHPQSVVFSSRMPSNNEVHGCENEVVITNIVFCVSPDKLDSSSRLKLIHDMSQFLSLPETSVMLLPSSGQKLRALEDGFQIVSAGPGNAGFCEEDSNMELSWEISCSTLKHLADFVSILQHNIEVGRVQKESGVGVVGWYIASSNSVITSAHKRKRRRAGRTPFATPVVSPVTPTKDVGSSTILPTTSFKPELSYTSYIPGLPNVQIAIRSSHSSYASTKSYDNDQPTKSIPSLTTMTTSSRTHDIDQPNKSIPSPTTSTSTYDIVHPTTSILSTTQSSTTITRSRTSIVSSQDAFTPSPSESFRPSRTIHQPLPSAYPGSSMDHPYSTFVEASLSTTESGMIESSSQPETSYAIDKTLTSTPILSSTSGYTRPTSQTDAPAPSETYRRSSYEWTSESSMDVHRSKDVVYSKEIFTIPTTSSVSSIVDGSTESSVYEGSATDAIDTAEGSASGDKMEEGSASGSGAEAIDIDDEDSLRSSLDVSVTVLSSSFTPTFSSSLVYIPQPEDSGIIFEHPTDIYPVSDITESSLVFTKLSPSISPPITTEVMSSRIPSMRPLYPDEEMGEETISSIDTSTKDSGYWETILDENVSTYSGHGRVEDHTEKVMTSNVISEHTTSKTSQNVIIEELETTTPTKKAWSTTKRMDDFTSMTSQGPSSTTDRLWVPGGIENKYPSTIKSGTSTTHQEQERTTIPAEENPTRQTEASTASTTERRSDWPSVVTNITPRGRTDWGTATYGIFSQYFTTIPTKMTTKWWRRKAEVTTLPVFVSNRPVVETSTEFSFVTQRPNTKEKNRKKDKKGKKKKDKKKKNRKNKSTIGYWDWQTTFTVKPTSPSATKWPSLPGGSNQKPYLENSIDYIEATLGQYFEYPIPRNVFYDIEDGDTRNLELSLSLPYDQPLPPTFWLQLDSRKQVIRGLPLAVDVDTGYQNVNLIARDSGGLTEIDSIKINVNSSVFGKFTHKFIMRFGVDFATFMNDRTNLNNLLRLIAGYFGDSNVKDITVLDVSVGSLLLTWSNNSLSGDECNNNTITQLYGRMVRRDGSIRTALNRHFGKTLPIQELEYQPYGACNGMTTTVATTTFRAETAEDTGLSIWAQVVLPVMVSLLVILLIVLLILLINRRRKKKQEPTTWDKPVFNNDRNPIIFPEELEREESKPKKTGTLNSDGSLSSGASRNSRPFYYFEDDPESNDSTLNSERSRTGSNKRPPKAPPPYWQPHSEPPPYRLPPPYAPQQTNV